MEAYERQVRETDQAWEAFTVYRDQEGRRSYRRVAEQLGKSETIIARWSQRWHWLDRIGEWERAEDAAWRAERLNLRRAEARRQLRVYQSVANAGITRLMGIDPATFSARELLDYVKLGLQGTAKVLGVGEEEESLTGVRIYIDPTILPPGAQLPELER
jgi:hypothetical protein